MKLTKVLRQKVEKELNEKRQQLDKKAMQNYEDREKKASEEIKEYLMTVASADIQKILMKYNMDTDKIISEKGWCSEIIDYRSYQIKNEKELNKIKREEVDRYNKMLEMLEDFEIECELGVEKKNFLEALSNLCSKFETEAK